MTTAKKIAAAKKRVYYDQLAELQKKFWFERLDLKEYCVRYDAINKRIAELENE